MKNSTYVTTAIIIVFVAIGFYSARKYPLICANSVAAISVLTSIASGWILQRAVKGKATGRRLDQPPTWYDGRVRSSVAVAAILYVISALLLLVVIAGHVNGFRNDIAEKLFVTVSFCLAPIAWQRNEARIFDVWVRKCDAERQKFEREHFKQSRKYIGVCWGATAALFMALLVEH